LLAIVFAIAVAVAGIAVREWVVMEQHKQQLAKELRISSRQLDRVLHKIKENRWDQE